MKINVWNLINNPIVIQKVMIATFCEKFRLFTCAVCVYIALTTAFQSKCHGFQHPIKAFLD